MADELNPDITPYHLADRLCAGRTITEIGKREIAHELRMVQSLVTNMQAKINDGACNTDDLIEFVGKLVKRMGFEPGDL